MTTLALLTPEMKNRLAVALNSRRVGRLFGAQLDELIQQIADAKQSVDGNHAVKVARATFNPSAVSGQRTIGAHGLGVFLPDNAIIKRSWYSVETTFTSATDAATIALGTPTDGSAAGIKAAVAISNVANAWDAGLVEGIQVGTAATFHARLTAQRELTATVAVEALTAGKLILFVEYVVAD